MTDEEKIQEQIDKIEAILEQVWLSGTYPTKYAHLQGQKEGLLFALQVMESEPDENE